MNIQNEVTVTKSFQMETAHWLRHHQGKCRSIHGHSYQVDVSITGRLIQQPNSLGTPGMVVDFTHIKTAFNDTLGHFDHALLAPWTNSELENFRETLSTLDAFQDFQFTDDFQKVFPCYTDPTAEWLATLGAHSIVDWFADKHPAEDVMALSHINVAVWETENSHAMYGCNFTPSWHHRTADDIINGPADFSGLRGLGHIVWVLVTN